MVAIDISQQLIDYARQKTPADIGAGCVDFQVGDMLDPNFGNFDFVVAMDSLIHYAPHDMLSALSRLAERAERRIVFTYAPRTPILALMHSVGRLFPASNRAPSIEPMSEAALQDLVAAEPALASWQPGRTKRVANGFYTSQAMELARP